MTSRIGRACVTAVLAGVVLAGGPGCSSHQRNYTAIRSYYGYDFTAAREALREDAGRNDTNVLLNNMRLGLAALADGDTLEAEEALGRSFDLLSTAGLNDDRTTAAIVIDEGVLIWKGEPFEQALSYYWVAALYATLDDWENVRAASANALFRLTDFGSQQTARTMTRNAAADPEYLEKGYSAVDTDFALGFLMEAIGSSLSGAGGADNQLDAAMQIDRKLAPIVSILRSGDYDTLLLVDYGKGPTKMAYGPDDALARFVPQERHHGDLVVSYDGVEQGPFRRVCDVNRMSIDMRWNNLENIRVAKSTIGNMLLTGGAVTLAAGAASDNGGAAAVAGIVGLTMMMAGALFKAGAAADDRYLEFAPQSIYIAPLRLNDTGELRIGVDGDPGSTIVFPGFRPGKRGAPQAVYLRMHGLDSADPPWLESTWALYGNDDTGVLDNDWPWILGGSDVSTPDPRTVEAYKLGGYLPDFTTDDLSELYLAEGIVIGAGGLHPATRQRAWRHILDGGRALYTPQPWSMGYKRLMYSPHDPYRPKSGRVRNLSPRYGIEYVQR